MLFMMGATAIGAPGTTLSCGPNQKPTRYVHQTTERREDRWHHAAFLVDMQLVRVDGATELHLQPVKGSKSGQPGLIADVPLRLRVGHGAKPTLVNVDKIVPAYYDWLRATQQATDEQWQLFPADQRRALAESLIMNSLSDLVEFQCQTVLEGSRPTGVHSAVNPGIVLAGQATVHHLATDGAQLELRVTETMDAAAVKQWQRENTPRGPSHGEGPPVVDSVVEKHLIYSLTDGLPMSVEVRRRTQDGAFAAGVSWTRGDRIPEPSESPEPVRFLGVDHGVTWEIGTQGFWPDTRTMEEQLMGAPRPPGIEVLSKVSSSAGVRLEAATGRPVLDAFQGVFFGGRESAGIQDDSVPITERYNDLDTLGQRIARRYRGVHEGPGAVLILDQLHAPSRKACGWLVHLDGKALKVLDSRYGCAEAKGSLPDAWSGATLDLIAQLGVELFGNPPD